MTNDEAMDEFLSAMVDVDMKRKAALMAPDVEVTDWLLPGRTLRGAEEVNAQFFSEPFLKEHEFVVLDTIRTPDVLVVRGSFSGRLRPEMGGSSGEESLLRDVPCHDIYVFRDGLIVRIWYAQDTNMVLSAAVG